MNKEYENDETADKELIRRAKLRCMKLLEYSDKTEAQLRKRLKEGDFPPFAIDEAIEYVKQYHYLNDERFAQNYVLQQGGRKSRRRLAQDLALKGIDSESIENALEQSSQNEEDAAAMLLEKHARGKDMTQEKVQWNQLRYLTGKGFSYDLSKKVLRKYLESQETEE